MIEGQDFTIDERYQELLQTILDFGIEKKDRTKTGTKSIFGYTIRHDMTQGFPLLTTKKMAYKSMITELKWMLKGDTNIKYLVNNRCNIWNGDAYKKYLNTYKGNFELDKEEFINAIKTSPEFAEQWGELGPIYGKQWRSWKVKTTRDEKIVEPGVYTKEIDQIANLINELKTNPDSRRLMVNAWNVGELDQMTLPPCHYGFQIYTTELTLKERQEEFCHKLGKSMHYAKNFEHTDLDKSNTPKRKISLMWNQRSCDVFLGLPFNLASYALLLELIGKEVNMVPDQLIGNLGDTHLYLNHLEQAKEQINRDPIMLPEIDLLNVDILNGEFEYTLIDYEYHPTIKAALSN
jgi:thymidylate synthase